MQICLLEHEYQSVVNFYTASQKLLHRFMIKVFSVLIYKFKLILYSKYQKYNFLNYKLCQLSMCYIGPCPICITQYLILVDYSGSIYLQSRHFLTFFSLYREFYFTLKKNSLYYTDLTHYFLSCIFLKIEYI